MIPEIVPKNIAITIDVGICCMSILPEVMARAIVKLIGAEITPKTHARHPYIQILAGWILIQPNY